MDKNVVRGIVELAFGVLSQGTLVYLFVRSQHTNDRRTSFLLSVGLSLAATSFWTLAVLNLLRILGVARDARYGILHTGVALGSISAVLLLVWLVLRSKRLRSLG